METGPPITDPAETASRLLERSGADAPSYVRFEWSYSDRRGDVDGEGVARFNPPDSLRLDLFTSGDVAMQVALAGGALSTLGQIEDVEVPSPPFLFAMAGLFRPDSDAVPRGFVAGGDTVLVYEPGPTALYFFTESGRLAQVEERRGNRVLRKVELEWGDNPRWPAEAEFRDLDQPSRVRWRIRETRIEEDPYPSDIFMLPNAR